MGNIAVVHSGGDTPVSNGVLYGLIAGLQKLGFEGGIHGYCQGYEGILRGGSDHLSILAGAGEADDFFGIHTESGVIIGSSRANPLKIDGGIGIIAREFEKREIDRLVTLSGDDGIKVARACHDFQGYRIGCIHVAKSIDDDLPETDLTFGAWSARDLAAEQVRRLQATTKTHKMALFVQFMGRNSGKLTLYGGLAGGCHIILIPEFPNWSLDGLAKAVKAIWDKYGYAIIGINEELGQAELKALKKQYQNAIGAASIDQFGHEELSKELVSGCEILAKEIGRRLEGIECRAQKLDRICRSGPPCAFDVWLATHMGLEAAKLLMADKTGLMVNYKDGKIGSIPIESVPIGQTRSVSRQEYQDWQLLSPVKFPDIG